MPRSSKPGRPDGMLDLSAVEHAPVKVKLPDGKLYDMASPGKLGLLPQQRILSRYRRAQELMALQDATESDAEEIYDLLLDVAQVVLPDAPRDVLGQLGLSSIDRLVRSFSQASPWAATPTVEAETSTSVT